MRYLILLLLCFGVLKTHGQSRDFKKNDPFSNRYDKIYEDKNVVEYIVPDEYFDTIFPTRHFPPYTPMLGPIPATSETGVLDMNYYEQCKIKLDSNHIPNKVFDPKDSLFLRTVLIPSFDYQIRIENLKPHFLVREPKKINELKIEFDSTIQIHKKIKFYNSKLNLLRELRISKNSYHEITYKKNKAVKETWYKDGTLTSKEKTFNLYAHYPVFTPDLYWEISKITDAGNVFKGYDKDFNLTSLYINYINDDKDIYYSFDQDGNIMVKQVRYNNSKITIETYDRFYTMLCYDNGKIKSLEIQDFKSGQSNYLHWSPSDELHALQKIIMKIDKVVINGKEIHE